MTALAALGLSLLGFAALALSMHKHHRDILGRKATPWRRRVLQAAGWLVLALALTACIDGAGWAIGPVLWFGVLTLAALAAALGVTVAAAFAAARTGR